MKALTSWWHTTCSTCLQIRKVILDAAKLMLSLLTIASIVFSGLFIYWIWFDTSPAILYGPNGSKEFVDDKIIFHLDATRMRDCVTEIKRKISGCGQIDLPETFSTTPVGEKVPPISVSMATIFQSFSPQQLSGSVCTLVNQASSYCNPAQKLLHMFIVDQSPPISFIPVPRSKSYSAPPPP